MTITLTDDSGHQLTIRQMTNPQLNALFTALEGSGVRVFVGDYCYHAEGWLANGERITGRIRRDTENPDRLCLDLDPLTRWPHPRKYVTTPW